MPKPKQSKLNNAHLMLLAVQKRAVVELYFAGYNQSEIAPRVNVSQPRVSQILREVKAEWAKTDLAQIDEHIKRELARVDNHYAMAYEAWLKSCKDGETAHREVEKALRIVRAEDRDRGEKALKALIPVKVIERLIKRGCSGDPGSYWGLSRRRRKAAVTRTSILLRENGTG
jgi:predicted transcriptional regulator